MPRQVSLSVQTFARTSRGGRGPHPAHVAMQRAVRLLRSINVMDPLKYGTHLVGGRPYRLAHHQPAAKQQRSDMSDVLRLIMHEDTGAAAGQPQAAAQQEQAIIPLEESQVSQVGNQYIARLSCDAMLLPHLIGKQGAAKAKIEAASGATLSFPTRQRRYSNGGNAGRQWGGKDQLKETIQEQAMREEADDTGSLPRFAEETAPASVVTVTAADKQSLSLAYRLLEQAMRQVLAWSNGPDYNFFISLPVCTASVQEAAVRFQEQSQAAAGGDALFTDMFMKPEKLHITVCMLKLYSDDARQQAIAVLKQLQPMLVQDVLGGAPLELRLKGLELMNGNPTATSVVYAKVDDPTGRLPLLCAAIVNAYLQAGLLLPKDNQATKVHVTLINTKYHRPDNNSVNAPEPSNNISTKAAGNSKQQAANNSSTKAAGNINQQAGNNTITQGHASVSNRGAAPAAGSGNPDGIADDVPGNKDAADRSETASVADSSVQGDSAAAGNRRRRWTRITVDVRSVLEKCGNFDFGPCTLQSVHLSHRSKVDPVSGYYGIAAEVDLPQ